MPDFTRLYLDTTVLRKSNWPRISAELSFLLESARNFGVEVLVPEAVEIEREAQWLRDCMAASQKLDAAADKFAASLDAISAARVAVGPRDLETLKAKYKAQSDAAKAAGNIRTIPSTTRSIPEFLKLAVERTPPFQIAGDKVTGFQDTIILFSAIDDAKAAGATNCAIVSEDDVFSKVRHITEAEGLRLRHFRTSHDVWKLLAEEISPHVVQWWNQQKLAIRQTLESQIDRVTQMLREKVTPEMVNYRVDRVEAIERLEIADVDMPLPPFPNTPGPYQTTEGAAFRVAVKIRAEFHTLAGPGLSALVAATFLRQMQERSGKLESQPSPQELSPETFWKSVEMETIATYSGGQYDISDLEFIRIE